MEETAHTDLTPTHSVALNPAFPHTNVSTLITQFKATNFISALSTYIRRQIPPPALPVLPNLVDRFDVYKQIRILQPSKPAAGFSNSVDRLRATPLVPEKGRSKAVPAHFDMVLVHVADSESDANVNQHTKGTCLEGIVVHYFLLRAWYLTRITQ